MKRDIDEDMQLKMGPNESYTEILISFEEPLMYLSFTPDQAVIFANGLMQTVKAIRDGMPKCH